MSKKRENKRICKGDKVYVLSGNERGQVGTVLSHLGDKIIVQGLNMHKKHVKKSEQHPQGGILSRESPLNISNVKLFVEEGKPVKIRVKTDKEGERQLVYQDGDQEVIYRSVKKSKIVG